MTEVLNFLRSMSGIPAADLIGVIALAAIGLAAFAIYVVHVNATPRKRK